ALVALAVVSLDRLFDRHTVNIVSGAVLVAWAFYHWMSRSRHRVRVGMRTGMVGLAVWSFLMASAHGAGLMLVPALTPIGRGAPAHVHSGGHVMSSGSLGAAFAAVGVHTVAMLGVTGVIAIVVYEWVGLAFLRRAWINLDFVWTIALIATGLILFATALY